ncbi:MAG TPA: DUF2339 domain-containing protein [Pyrinomonadaceae bacterium]
MSEDDSSRDDLRLLIRRLESLEHVLRGHTQRLYTIERRLGIDFLYSPPQQQHPPAEEIKTEPSAAAPPRLDGEPDAPFKTPTPTPNPTAASMPQAEPRASGQTQPYESPYGRRGAGADAGPAAGAGWARSGGGGAAGSVLFGSGEHATAQPKRARDMESLVGGSWFSWLGIIAIVFGVAFFLKYAFDSEWVGPGARVALGAVAGLSIIVLAEVLRARGLRQYAHVLSGGGLLILYLSVYAARAFYEMMGQPVAFLLMSLVTTGAVALSVRHDALAIAILGLIGGFFTPVLLSTGQDNQVGLFTYVALLDAGVLAVAHFKRWRVLNFLSFFATAAMFVGWMDTHYLPEKLGPSVFFLTLFFLLFSALAPVQNVLGRQGARWYDVLLVVLNATFYYTLAYSLLDGAGYTPGPLGFFTLAVAALYALLYVLTRSRRPADRLLAYSYVGAAVTFLTLALAVWLEQQWMTVGWAVEGLALVWVGLRGRERALRRVAMFVFVVALVRWFAADMSDFGYSAMGAGFVPLWNARAFSAAVLVAALVAAAWAYRRAALDDEEERAGVSAFLTFSANAVALMLLTLDANDYFEARLARLAGESGDQWGRVENTRQLTLSALWTLYGAAALSIGIGRARRGLRYAGLALLAVAALKVLLLDLRFYDAAWHAPLFNQTFAAFALLVAALCYALRLYSRAEKFEETDRVVPALVVAANLLAVVALSAEASGYFAAGSGPDEPTAGAARDLRLARELSLSIVWALYGGALLAYGHLRRRRLPRLLALALLGLTTLKVFFWDLSSLDRIYRIISFVVLGLILLAVSYLYQKSQRAAGEEEAEATGAASEGQPSG